MSYWYRRVFRSRPPTDFFEPHPAAALHGGHGALRPSARPCSTGGRCDGRHLFQLCLLDLWLPAHGDHWPGRAIAGSRRRRSAHAPLCPRVAHRPAYRGLDPRPAEAAHFRSARAVGRKVRSASERDGLLQYPHLVRAGSVGQLHHPRLPLRAGSMPEPPCCCKPQSTSPTWPWL